MRRHRPRVVDHKHIAARADVDLLEPFGDPFQPVLRDHRRQHLALRVLDGHGDRHHQRLGLSRPLINLGQIRLPTLRKAAIPVAVSKVLADGFRVWRIVAPQHALEVRHEHAVDAARGLDDLLQTHADSLCILPFHDVDHAGQRGHRARQIPAAFQITTDQLRRDLSGRFIIRLHQAANGLTGDPERVPTQ